ncbi:hypothetical protein N7492_005404 [Penicillium capsulatum]|uniref:Aminotransferase class I/classII large domain-containing protein n=1 Tax=Penicillium capsulatum TaxID=69766 RepID=A0A9W9LRM2_9EURO|nr:hypothetical protein N7492_005404 [Penicillium capsulatum]KAJ6135498.1 hypothetical protein N7512_000658 [Penicillium capsulatum]
MEILSQKLQVALDNRHKDGRLLEPPRPDTLQDLIDLGSNDTLSLSSSKPLREKIFHQLQANPGVPMGSRSSRIFEGTGQYLIDIERNLAEFHGSEAGIFFNSGYDANVAVWSTLPQPGDVVLYDEYVHASIHDGMRRGRAKTMQFRHNDPSSFRDCLRDIVADTPAIARGASVAFVALESFYSMDGDAAPARELIKIAQQQLPLRNFIFSIDEAHSNGLIGPNGSGFVCYHALEKEVMIRLNTCGKALGLTGAILLCNDVMKRTLINYSRGVMFSTAPSFVMVAAVKASYQLLASAEGQKRRDCLQQNIYSFHRKLTGHPKWIDAKAEGILALPTERAIHLEPFLSPVISLITPPYEAKDLQRHLQRAGFWVNVAHYPIVPKNKDRVRIVVHTHNTEKQIDNVVEQIMHWASGRCEKISI